MSYKHKNPSADRNQRPILDVLFKVLDGSTPNLKLLEISSGTGQHCGYFADYFPNITFQPSEYNVRMLKSIQSYAEDCRHKNILDPCIIDVTKDYKQWYTINNKPFEENSIDYILNVNMIHITPWPCTQGLFYNAGKLLKTKGLLITYGPYAVDGILLPESNIRFNAMLHTQNSEWGIRDVRDLKSLGEKYNIRFKEMYEMPANNKVLIWEKEKS